MSGTTSPIIRRMDYQVQMNDIFQATATHTNDSKSLSEDKDPYSQRKLIEQPVHHLTTSRPSQDENAPSIMVRARRGRDLAAVDSTVIFSTNEQPHLSVGSVSQGLSSYNRGHYDINNTNYSFDR